MATVFHRNKFGKCFNVGKPQPKPKIPFVKAQEIIIQSKCDVFYIPHKFLKITFSGLCSKFPSVTNSRQVSVPKAGVINLLLKAKANPSRSLIDAALGLVYKLQPTNIKNPAHSEVLKAASYLWQKKKPETFDCFKTEIDCRLFMFVFCGKALRRHDTHNILKAACDWSQLNGIYKNDLHVDAISLRAEDFLLNENETTFIYIWEKNIIGDLLQTIRNASTYDTCFTSNISFVTNQLQIWDTQNER